MTLDFTGCVLGWKYFDHAAHLGGALFGMQVLFCLIFIHIMNDKMFNNYFIKIFFIFLYYVDFGKLGAMLIFGENGNQY